MIDFFQIDYLQLGSIRIYTWGLMLALGFLFGYLSVKKELCKMLGKDRSFNFLIFLIIGALFGARLGYGIQFTNYYFQHPLEILFVWQGGLTFYGGLIGAILFGWFYLHRYLFRKDFLKLADYLVVGLSLGLAIGRIGCSLINDHIGAITKFPWGIVYLDGIARHPVAWYLVLSNLLIFFILLGMRRRKLSPGILTVTWLGVYGLSRFVLDFTRATDLQISDPHLGDLFVAQWISLFLMVASVVFFRRLRNHNS